MMKKLLEIVLGIVFVGWAWSSDLLIAWLWVISAGLAMAGIVYFGAVIGSDSLEIEGTETGLKLYWSSLMMMLFGFATLVLLAVYWSKSDDPLSLTMSVASWVIILLLVTFGLVIFHDRMVTKQKLEKR